MVNLAELDVVPAGRMVEMVVEVDPDSDAVVGARFRAAAADGTKEWPWTRDFPAAELPVRLKWAYLTEGEECPMPKGSRC